MSGFFLRPKTANLDKENNHINAEPIGVVESFENEYIPTTGFDSTTDGISGADHRRDPIQREAAPGAPLPGGSWRGGVSRNVSSGFGKGTRAGNTGVKRGR